MDGDCHSELLTRRKNKDLKDSKTEEKKSRKHQFFCKQHGYNNTHATEDCRFLKFQRDNKNQTNAATLPKF